jgi:hypothetical protein
MVLRWFPPLSLFLLLRRISFILLHLLLFAPLPFVLRFLLPLPLLFPFALRLPLFPVRLLLFSLLHLLLFDLRRHQFVLVLPVTFVTGLAAARLHLLQLQPPLLLTSWRASL